MPGPEKDRLVSRSLRPQPDPGGVQRSEVPECRAMVLRTTARWDVPRPPEPPELTGLSYLETAKRQYEEFRWDDRTDIPLPREGGKRIMLESFRLKKDPYGKELDHSEGFVSSGFGDS